MKKKVGSFRNFRLFATVMVNNDAKKTTSGLKTTILPDTFQTIFFVHCHFRIFAYKYIIIDYTLIY